MRRHFDLRWTRRVAVIVCMHVLATLFSPTASAASEAVQVTNAWARATVPGQKVAGVYLDLRAERDAIVLSVKSPAAASAEIHSMSTDNGVMRMRKLDAMALPSGQAVTLSPGGNHIMLLDIKQQLKAGDKVPLTLVVQDRGSRKKIDVKVEAIVKELKE